MCGRRCGDDIDDLNGQIEQLRQELADKRTHLVDVAKGIAELFDDPSALREYAKRKQQFLDVNRSDAKEKCQLIRRCVKKHRGILCFQDESNVSLIAFLGKTWAPLFQTAGGISRHYRSEQRLRLLQGSLRHARHDAKHRKEGSRAGVQERCAAGPRCATLCHANKDGTRHHECDTNEQCNNHVRKSESDFHFVGAQIE